jgi:hypothetical protein
MQRPTWCSDLLQEVNAGRMTRPWYRILINALYGDRYWDAVVHLLIVFMLVDRNAHHPDLDRLLRRNPAGLMSVLSLGHAGRRGSASIVSAVAHGSSSHVFTRKRATFWGGGREGGSVSIIVNRHIHK